MLNLPTDAFLPEIPLLSCTLQHSANTLVDGGVSLHWFLQGSGLYEEGGLVPEEPGSGAGESGVVGELGAVVCSFCISSGSSCPA